MALAVNSKKSAAADPVLYLYGLTKNAEPPPQTPGVDDIARIESINCAGLVCWISRVSRAEFADNLAKNIENLDWLAPMSVRHQRAVAAIAERADILPARFGTVFLDEPSLMANIKSRKVELQEDFRRIQGSEEWGVKVFALPPQATPLPSSVRSGKEYLQAKSALRKRVNKGSDAQIVPLADALKEISVATAQGGSISGGRRDLQFQISVLVRKRDREKLEDVLAEFSRRWKRTHKIECTGPWPPYSFVSRSIQ
jgi:Gas vesicle synthesis protein GvpL/GvpF